MRNRRHTTADAEDEGFALETQDVFLNLYGSATSNIYIVTIGVAAISLVVGGIVVMNIMLVSVTERISEIGLRKALGARRWMISWQFLLESAAICAMGGVIGVGCAYLATMAIQNALPATMPVWLIITGVIFSAVVGIFFGLYPSVKAARLAPIEALRQE